MMLSTCLYFCLFSVMALGWHLVQMPLGHGRCPSQPDLILQLMFSKATNFPLSAPPVSFRMYAWKDMCFTGGSRWFR